jgi:Tfp pilus assembly pilus retraction ATPase PilT
MSGRSSGMHTMEDSLARLYGQGLITYDQAVANANNPACLASPLKR